MNDFILKEVNAMNKLSLKVPREINYISDWNDFGKQIPGGKVILDKQICGCGCTEFFLNLDNPIILVSPRRELINCKMNSDAPRPFPLYYFDRSKRKPVETTINELNEYVDNFKDHSKILVTYDSLALVLDQLAHKGVLQYFNIVVDEFTSIFTDVKLKGNIELNLISRLQTLPNSVVYISATPINEIYLDELDEFKNTTYLQLQWDPARTETVTIDKHTMVSTQSAIKNIIANFRERGYFQALPINNTLVESKEAVFFVNNVSAIVSIIKSCNLSPNDTLVICAEDKKNVDKLNDVGFTIGHVPNRKNYQKDNKTFTFVTKASFEGVDFYSDNSTSYIFADARLEHMALDISIDIPQIIGRCRCSNNPFRQVIEYYYKTSGIDSVAYEEAKDLVEKRIRTTEAALKELQNITCTSTLNKIRDGQKVWRYKDDYVDIDENSGKCVFNKLAKLADLRAIDIKMNQYKTTYTVISQIENQGYQIAQPTYISDRLQQFLDEFLMDNVFTRKMKLYCDFLYEAPEYKAELEAIHEIPYDIKRYYNILGSERIKSLKYRETYIEQEIQNMIKDKNVGTLVYERFQSGVFYSNEYTKTMMQQIYNKLGIERHAKATDLQSYIPGLTVKSVRENGKRIQGYKF